MTYSVLLIFSSNVYGGLVVICVVDLPLFYPSIVTPRVPREQLNFYFVIFELEKRSGNTCSGTFQLPSVSDRIEEFTPTPPQAHTPPFRRRTGSWDIFRNQKSLETDSSRLMTTSTSDSIVVFTPAPTPCSLSPRDV
jgi:hypothetical protein